MKYFDRHAIETRLLLFTVLGYGQHRGAVLKLLYTWYFCTSVRYTVYKILAIYSTELERRGFRSVRYLEVKLY